MLSDTRTNAGVDNIATFSKMHIYEIAGERFVALLTAGTSTIKDEQGIEVFYDFAITPAVRLIPSYQHIWQPLAAQVATRQSEADVFLARLNVAW